MCTKIKNPGPSQGRLPEGRGSRGEASRALSNAGQCVAFLASWEQG
jgi:hypothetical protein